MTSVRSGLLSYSTAAAVAALLLWAGRPDAARANVAPSVTQYDFVGVCAEGDCANTGVGHLYLLSSYQPGTDFAGGDILRFTYASNLVSFDLQAADSTLGGYSGGLSASLPGFSDLTIFGYSSTFSERYNFASDSAGIWSVSITQPDLDHGTNGVWSVVPEPASLAILGAAFVGLGVVARRRGKGALTR